MATVKLNRTEKQFWKMTPRVLVSLIEECRKIELENAKTFGFCVAAYMNGKDPSDLIGDKAVEITEAEKRKNGALFF